MRHFLFCRDGAIANHVDVARWYHLWWGAIELRWSVDLFCLYILDHDWDKRERNGNGRPFRSIDPKKINKKEFFFVKRKKGR